MVITESTKTLRVLIVDDEPIACNLLEWMLRDDQNVEIAGICTDGPSALKAIKQKHPDLVFLDVQMPGLTGLELLRYVKEEERPHLIFVTAYDHYAVDAFEVEAIDYLLKPFNKKRFDRALERAKQQIFGQRKLGLLQNLASEEINRSSKREYIARLELKFQGRILFVPATDVAWIEAADQYVDVHCTDKSYLLRVSMNRLESILDPSKFVRVDRSAIVNVDYIKEAILNGKGQRHIVLKDGSTLKLSRRRVSALRRSSLPASRIR